MTKTKTKHDLLVNRFSKQDGELYDTIPFERALKSLESSYKDMSLVKKDLLEGRKVQTCFMFYELEKTK